MESLCDVGLLHLLLLMTTAAGLNSNSATAAGQGRTRPAWTQYIDAMYAVCISQEVAEINMKLTTLSRCFNAQREYLQCTSSVYPSDKFLAVSRTSSGLQTPCGLIHLSSENEASFTRRRWIIRVHSQLYLNLTVLELVLPMPYGKCNRSEGSEYLVIRHEIHSSNPCSEGRRVSVWRTFTILIGMDRKSCPASIQTCAIHYTDRTFSYSVPSV